MKGFTGQVAFVTGGSRGIGAAIVRRLAMAGADVSFTYLNSPQQAQALAAELEPKGCRVVALQADSASPHALFEAIEETIRLYGRLDILVNSAGIFPYGAPESFTVDDIDKAFAVHARAAFIGAQAAAAHMERGGRIISIGSCFVERVPVPGISLYAMTKAALTGLTKALARDLGPRGITVNLVHPGPTDTDMNPADGPTADEERAHMALGHYGRPEDIADAVAYLASANGRFVTGAAITVDGGYAV